MLKTKQFFHIFLLSILLCTIYANDEEIFQLWIPHLSENMGSCSEFFEYRRTDDFINGKLELPNIRRGDTVKMTFCSPRRSEGFKGIFLPDESPQTVINRIKNGQTIKYRVDFPVLAFVPELLKIFINGNELCSTKFNACGSGLVFKHTMSIINDTLPVFTYNINIPTFIDTEDGVSELTPFVYGGKEIIRGEYPWLTAIYKKQRTDLAFICGGSLVTSKIILTAAHCFDELGMNPKRIVAMLGRHDLNDYKNGSVLIRQIKTLILHPEYKTGKNFSDADLALLEIKNAVSFTKFIKPICLWSEPPDESLIVNHIAVVAGWGSDAAGKAKSSVPKKVKINIVSENTCLRSSVAFTVITSTRTLCAGNLDGSGPCEGDSGGGLMMRRNGRWTLRGIVSAGLTFEWRCNLQEYVVYCDIAKHISWLKQNIDRFEHPITDTPGAICGKSDTVQQKQPTIQSVKEVCGISGEESRSKNPWLAAIYGKVITGLEFSCTGALITSRSVLAPADCFIFSFNSSSLIGPDIKKNKIYLGRYDLSNFQEHFVLTRTIATITVHPDFKIHGIYRENNVAVLQMNAPVSFTEFVNPICLRNGPNDGQSQIVEQSATISGWEFYFANYGIFSVASPVEINTSSIESCLSQGFNESIASRVVCIPRLDNQIGSILTVKHNGRWVLRGMNALGYNYRYESVFAFTDIPKYLPWIEGNMS